MHLEEVCFPKHDSFLKQTPSRGWLYSQRHLNLLLKSDGRTNILGLLWGKPLVDHSFNWGFLPDLTHTLVVNSADAPFAHF